MTIDWPLHVRTADIGGRRVRYVDYGSGPAVVLVHGMAGSWENWLRNIPALADGYRVVALDLPGFGGSDPLPKGSEFESYAQTVLALVDSLGIDDIAVVGHSLGGLVALTLAAAEPDRVGCVFLVAGGGAELSAMRLKAIQAAFLFLRIVMLLPGAGRALRAPRVGRLVLATIVDDPAAVPDELVSELMPRSVGPGFMDAVRLGGRWLGRFDVRSVVAPVRLIWGRDDRVLPLEIGQRLAFGLPNARLTVLDHVGHCPMFERPAECNQAVNEFVGQFRVPAERAGRTGPDEWSWSIARRDGLQVGEWYTNETAG